ncbi:MAG: hypothetical protein EZS28_017221 [Streblomastix strix]|uniref:Uncharacterized protein n=1 Tax=Streblomastix strix TaxID=222440 RepID=A0A5J4VY27_9EUKA|nr:MAG: hypothetical protein EZS28_017221 [Streblomastix strix]
MEDEGCCGRKKNDALLLLKADKSDLIDAYSKIEDVELLALKLNISNQIDAYTKYDDDALLLLKADKSELIDAYSKIEDDELLTLKLNISNQIDAYTKYGDDALLLLKADKQELIDAYSKIEDDELLTLKLNISYQINAYARTEVDALLNDKLNITDQINAYNKQKDDALLLLKAKQTELDNYVDLTSTQTITDQKQFGIISVSNISKQNKNNASILPAVGGDMIVSSFVSQPQLQEDSTGLRALETEQPDMSNLITILGTATIGDNAITNLSFSGNTLIPAKNSSFITTNQDETTTDQKTFKTIILSVGIMDQNYDNNSVVCADISVKIIQDINAKYDALLLLKVNQSITFTKTEIDYLISQVDVGDVDLSGYMTLSTAQTIITNKTFNCSCRFASSIDGMSTVTVSSFIKSRADDTVVLLGAAGTKPISKFSSSVYDSNYVKKTGQDSQLIHGVLRRNEDEV